jgi:effector-binding domain-containing protein
MASSRVKKQTKILSLIIVPIAILVIGYVVPYTKEKQYKIPYSIIDVAAQLRNPEKWADWNSSIKKACEDATNCTVLADYPKHEFSVISPDQTILVKERNPTTFEIEKIENRIRYTHSYVTLAASPSSIDSTMVHSIFRVSLLKWLVSYVRGCEQELDPVSELKNFMETPILYYQYPIDIRNVIDTIVLVNKKKVPLTQMYTVLPELFSQLRDHIKANDLSILQPPIAAFSITNKDSVTITTMNAVNRVLPFSKNNPNTFRMPKNGRMLVGSFKGKFLDRKALYESMERYVRDKKLTTLITSYEKYMDGKLPVSSDSQVELEVYFPIY